jgi:hypothetical protein
VEVILFYAVLIGGLALVAAAYISLLVAPVGLIAYRLGPVLATAYAVTLGLVLHATYDPPFGGASLTFAPAGMRAAAYLSRTVSDPPYVMIICSAAMSLAALLVLLVGWLADRLATR